MLEVIAELQIEEDDQQLHQLRVVDQMAGPQQLLPQLTQFQPADTPGAARGLPRPAARLSGVHGRQHRDPARGAGLRPDRAAHRRRADDRPDRADARGPDRVGDRARRWSRSRTRRDRERVRDVVRDLVYPADRAFLEALKGDYLGRDPRGARDSGRRPTASSSTGRRSAAGRRSTSIPRRSTGSGSTSSTRSSSSAARSRAAAGFGDDTAAYRAALDADPATRPGPKDELVARAHEDIERAMAARAALLRRPAAGRAARSARSRSTRRRTRRSPTTTRRRPTARGPGSTTPTATTCRAASTRSSRRRPTTRRRPATTSRSRSRWRTRHLITFRRLGARMVGGAYVEGWGLYSERLADEMGLFRDEAERFGMLDAQAWRAARLVVDTGLHALRWPRQRSIDFLKDGRPVRDRRGDRDRPLHLLARPGADLQDRPARDRAAARRAVGARRVGVRPARLPRRGPRPRLAAAGDAHARLPNWLASPV